MPEFYPPTGVASAADANGAFPSSSSSATPGVTVMLDNYDSFTYNIVEYLCELGANLAVFRNDEVTVADIEALNPVNIVISPGPGHPLNDSGISIDVIHHFAGKIPILGVCMGLQCMYAAYTGIVEFAGEILHGKTSAVLHDGKGLYAGLPADGVVGTRYHSLAAQLKTLPTELVVTSKTESGVVMGIRHTRFALEAVQYHPESILSKGGKEMFANFLKWRGGTWETNPQAGIDAKAITQAEATKAPVMAMAAGGAAAVATGAAAVVATNGTHVNGVEAASSAPASAPAPGTAAVGTILERIHVQRLKDIEASKALPGLSQRDLDTAIAMHLCPPLIDFPARLARHADKGWPGVMAEMKRASPSKGDIDPDAHAGAQALAYARGGASVISVLTEPKWFKGSLNDLSLARKAVEGMPDRPAILRKDFIVDTYQICEARIAGADTVLLIVAMLSDAQLKHLYDFSRSLGMEPLVEVNNPEEMERALKLGARVIGVNNRNLHDFQVDMDTTSRLADAAKQGGDGRVILCALSGITGRADVVKYQAEGVGAVLVGEALMSSANKKAFIHGLLGIDGAANGAAVAEGPASQRTLVKICGIQTPDAAVSATLASADLLGLILAPGTKRTLTLPQAAEIVNVVRSLRGGSESIRSAAAATLNGASAAGAESVAAASAAADASASVATGEEWFHHHAARLASHPHRPLIVGVFRDQPLSEIIRFSTALRLDVVQLHGRTENIEWTRLLPGVLVIRVFHVGPNSQPGVGELRDVNRPGYHHISALDTAGSVKGQEGGSGESFDWSIAKRVALVDEVSRRVRGSTVRPQPLILAGGLTPVNVAEAIREVRPFAVDTSSGVDTEGRKDAAKIGAFCANAKAALAQA